MNPDHEAEGVDRLAIAEQVIVSAGNILAAAGFRRAEIGAFFRQAADHLGAEPDAGPPVTDTGRSPRIEALRREFAAIPPVRELEILQSRAASATGQPLRPEDLLALAMALVPHIAAAQDWLRSKAEAARLPIVAMRGDEPEAAGGERILLEEFEAPYSTSFELIAAAFSQLGEQRQHDAFRAMLVALVEHDITITPELKLAIESWIDVTN